MVYARSYRDSLRRKTRCSPRFPPLALITSRRSPEGPRTLSIGALEGCNSIALVGSSVGLVVEKLFPKSRFGRAEMFSWSRCQGFGSTLLIGASILLADAKIAVLVPWSRCQGFGSTLLIGASILLADAKIAVLVPCQRC